MYSLKVNIFNIILIYILIFDLTTQEWTIAGIPFRSLKKGMHLVENTDTAVKSKHFQSHVCFMLWQMVSIEVNKGIEGEIYVRVSFSYGMGFADWFCFVEWLDISPRV